MNGQPLLLMLLPIFPGVLQTQYYCVLLLAIILLSAWKSAFSRMLLLMCIGLPEAEAQHQNCLQVTRSCYTSSCRCTTTCSLMRIDLPGAEAQHQNYLQNAISCCTSSWQSTTIWCLLHLMYNLLPVSSHVVLQFVVLAVLFCQK